MKTLLLILITGLVAVCADKCTEKCAKCEVVERSECLAGMEKDAECGCCDVCSRFEGQKCDRKGAAYKHGQCGDGLECKSTTGGNICQCAWEEIICGSDGVTYTNLCHMMATAVRENRRDMIEVKSVGPCDPGAQIVSKPEYVRNSTNNNVVLSCEAIGFPTPSIHWIVTKANNKTFALPGDDNHIVSSTRGGPGKYQVTGWLQIEHLLKRHEGDYTCIAANEHKEDRAKARIKVVN
ncbi:unnamed protein product [Candidula unifasciata]|uniref:IGFBP-related protein 1 n=1 Tax=Candidula unifasciata TaxID=100452 RepID=A0A8S3ZFX9_9EUPU|nr:unnamed protein product [Candidula unifasciata]